MLGGKPELMSCWLDGRQYGIGHGGGQERGGFNGGFTGFNGGQTRLKPCSPTPPPKKTIFSIESDPIEKLSSKTLYGFCSDFGAIE